MEVFSWMMKNTVFVDNKKKWCLALPNWVYLFRRRLYSLWQSFDHRLYQVISSGHAKWLRLKTHFRVCRCAAVTTVLDGMVSSTRNAIRILTRALLGGGGVWTPPPPSGFSRIAKIQRRAAPPGFHPPYPPSFPQLLWKFRPKAMWGQVTRSGQVTQLQNNFPIAPRLQCFRESYETFGIWWGNQCLQNVYLGFLISVTSGQVIFATSPL